MSRNLNAMKMSFADFLINEFGECALEKYWSKKNEINPYKIGSYSDKKVWLICQEKEYHEDYLITPKNFRQGQRCPYCSGRKLHVYDSFYYWCINNNRNDLLDRWDYDLNYKSPKEYRYTVRDKIYLKCPRSLHESKLFSIQSIIRSKSSPCDKCNSIAQFLLDKYGEDGITLYWGKNNKSSSWDMSIESCKKCFFICQDKEYHPEYEMRAYDFKNNHRCPYCNGRKVCREDSFAQWGIDNIDKNFIETYWSEKNNIDPFLLSKCSQQKIWIKCQTDESHPDYQMTADRFYYGARCPYCSHNKICHTNSLGFQYPELVKYWSNNNEKNIFEVAAYSKHKYKWICEKHGEFETVPQVMIESYYKCPKCAMENKSKYETSVMNYLDDLNIKYLNEHNCNINCINPKTNKRLPYDNEIPDYKLIIEVHGTQHYFLNKIWFPNNYTYEEMKEKFEYMKWKDEFKKEYALSQGYEYLEIPYSAFNKYDSYKKIIDNKLNKITHQQRLNEKTA